MDKQADRFEQNHTSKTGCCNCRRYIRISLSAGSVLTHPIRVLGTLDQLRDIAEWCRDQWGNQNTWAMCRHDLEGYSFSQTGSIYTQEFRFQTMEQRIFFYMQWYDNVV